MSCVLDLHGLTVCAAIKEIQKTIINSPKCRCIEVIHGFNNGCELKNILRKKENIHSKRVIKTLPVPFNEGRTFIYLK